jgi:hypothetical protein
LLQCSIYVPTTDDEDMLARHVAMLRKHQAQGDQLADALHARAMAEADSAEQRRLSAAWHRIVRSVRQAMALEAKLKRDFLRDRREAEEREELAEAAEEGKVRGHVRVGGRLVWHEAEQAQRQSWGDFLREIAGRDTEQLRANPEALVPWLERRAEALAHDLEAARAALARGEPPPDPTHDHVHPKFGPEADSS